MNDDDLDRYSNVRRPSHRTAGEYLDQYGPDRALTKAEHDRIVNETGRPVTHDGRLRHQHNTTGPDGETVTRRNYYGEKARGE